MGICNVMRVRRLLTGVLCFLALVLFLFNLAPRSQVISVLENETFITTPSPSPTTYDQLCQLVEHYVCTIGAPSCGSPMATTTNGMPFDAAAFEHRPSGTSLLDTKNIVLLVLFNDEHFNVIPYLERIYTPIFSTRFYCGPMASQHLSRPLSRFSFFNETIYLNIRWFEYKRSRVDLMNGENNYDCFLQLTEHLSKVGDNSAGIFTIADDILLHPWNLASPGLDLSRPWLMDEPFLAHDAIKRRDCLVSSGNIVESCDEPLGWIWWQVYKTQLVDFYRAFEKAALDSRFFGDCYHKLKDFTGGPGRLIGQGGIADVYYIPRDLWAPVHDVLSLFAYYNVFMEIALPSAVRCLVAHNDTVHLLGDGMNWQYARTRSAPWTAYTPFIALHSLFYHPAKFGGVLRGTPDYACFFCGEVLSRYVWFHEYGMNTTAV